MGVWVFLSIGVQALLANRVRSFLTMLGIIIGIASIISLLAVGTGAKKRLLEQISSMGSNVILVVPGSTTAGGLQLGPGAIPTLTYEDARAIKSECPSVDSVAPNVRGGAQVVYGNQNWSTMILGVTPDFFAVREWPVLRGRIFSQSDVDGATKSCAIGKTIAEKLFGSMEPLGRMIRIQNMPFTVIGVLDRKGQSPQGTDQDDAIFIPLRTAQRRLFGGPFPEAIQAVLVRARDASSLQQAKNEMTSLLRQRHRIAGSKEPDFTVQSLTEIVSVALRSAKTMSLLLGAVASISLVVGGIGIMNIMLVSVTERTREIGIRMAIGARRRDVLFQFLVEAVLLTTLGGVIGIALGVAASMLSARILSWPAVVSGRSVVFAVLFSAVIGIFFGLYPARRAANLRPIDALRCE